MHIRKNLNFLSKVIFLVLLGSSFGLAETPHTSKKRVWTKVSSHPWIRLGPSPVIWVSETKTCFIYNRFLVIATGSEMDDTTTVYERNPKDGDGKKVCEQVATQSAQKQILEVSTGHFMGLSNPYLFIDEGSSVDSSALIVFRLDTKKELLRFSLSKSTGFKLKGDHLENDLVVVPEEEVAKLKTRPKCPKPRKDQQTEMGYQETMVGQVTIDLKTNTRIYSQIRCEYQLFE